MLSARRAVEWVPDLRADGLRGAAMYYDHQMNDSRVAITAARAAAEAGAVLLNHISVVGLRKTGSRSRVSTCATRWASSAWTPASS